MSKNSITNCHSCKKNFSIERYRLKDDKPKYCSPACWYKRPSIKKECKGKHMDKLVVCSYCKNEFHPWVVSEKRGNGKFCSRGCVTSNTNKVLAKKSIEIFYKNVLMPNNKNECWIWQKQKTSRYGKMTVNGIKSIGAHRFSYEYFNEEIPDGMFVCHHCDQPKCVNPKHLFLGTPQDNVDDKMRKGRFKCAIGEKQGHSKLTEKDVIEIKLKLKAGISRKNISKEYLVNILTIGKIARGETWRHIII